jgi:hypothetical protein
MKRLVTILFYWVVLPASALGQLFTLDPPHPGWRQDRETGVLVPDDATKTRALKRAYEINGGSMVLYGDSIDLTREPEKTKVSPTTPGIVPSKARK